MRLTIILLVLSLFSCVAEDKSVVESKADVQAQANSPEVMKALGEKDCDEKAKAKKIEEQPESIGLGKGDQGCTLE